MEWTRGRLRRRVMREKNKWKKWKRRKKMEEERKTKEEEEEKGEEWKKATHIVP